MDEQEDYTPSDPSEKEGRRREPGTMGFLDHLDELRRTAVRCVLAFLIAFVLVLWALPEVMEYLQHPFKQAAGQGHAIKLITNSPMGIFSVILQVAFLGSLTLSLPFILYFIGQFVAPALVEREKRLLRPVVLSAFALFLLGSAFAYYLIVPSTVRLSIALNEELGFEMMWSADRYYSLMLWMVIAMGGSFQFPLVLLLLVRIGLLSAEKLRAWRRYAIVVIFILAAVITPTPDPLTQILVAAPLYILYEVSIWLARAIEKKAEARSLIEDV
jgi:sec-independent protein translocase protein TatC